MLAFLLILFIAFVLRVYGINWDGGFHLHPDERMLIMVADKIHFFDQLHPHFFNYGSFPIYVLKGIAQLIDRVFHTQLATYDGMLLVGRVISVLLDIGTIFLIYRIARAIFKEKLVALYTSFFYAVAFFPIQNSHFFIVDVFLTFFSTLLVYLTITFFSSKHFSWYLTIWMGMVSGTLLAIKVSGVIFAGISFLVMLSKAFWVTDSVRASFPHARKTARLPAGRQVSGGPSGSATCNQLCKALIYISFYGLFTFMSFFLFMPYAFLDYKAFWADLSLQLKLNSDPYIFPYTLQYVGTTPYLYYIKNIFLWGLGPFISLLSASGIAMLIVKLRKKNTHYFSRKALLIYTGFVLIYFIIIGNSSVKFMRYMLLLYPFLCLMAGYGVYRIQNYSQDLRNAFNLDRHPDRSGGIPAIEKTATITILIIFCVWTLLFMNIYFKPHTRITATEWILHNVPPGSTIAIEHWDDRLPLNGGENFNFVEMTLYDLPDNEAKWQRLSQNLETTDYIILASNRLYVPLQKLADCTKYMKCYPLTAEYYRDLFSGRLRFQKVAQFEVSPSIQIASWRLKIDDQGADESFTVYDHPTVIIFKKSQRVSSPI